MSFYPSPVAGAGTERHTAARPKAGKEEALDPISRCFPRLSRLLALADAAAFRCTRRFALSLLCSFSSARDLLFARRLPGNFFTTVLAGRLLAATSFFMFALTWNRFISGPAARGFCIRLRAPFLPPPLNW